MLQYAELVIRIPIGDWSGDGHGQCEWFSASSVKALADVREAYFAACDDIPADLHPENICRNYEDSKVSTKSAAQIRAMSGIDISNGDTDSAGNVYVDLYAFAKYVVWFINTGDHTVDAILEPRPDILQFSGFDEKGRHIGFIGYGLM